MEDLESLVVKLRKRLEEAAQEELQEEKVWKILTKLAQLPMSLELLQVTHIGKQVNGFKKHNGRIGQKAKELVTKWKELIPDKAPPDQRPSNATPQGSSVTPTSRHRKEPLPSSSHPTPSQSHTPNKARISNDVTLPSMGSSGRASSGSWSTKDRTPLPYTESESREDEHGSSINSSTGNLVKKRKAAVLDVETLDAMALSKRSKTQVYSGKKTITGPQTVPSLFDLCMDVLGDNIDAIEEVGGVPCSILEPVLQKCTPTQLMRLESFNPHFIEDTDGLWEKHCKKEFKQAQVTRGQTWRDFYLDQLSEREARLRNIAANIKAKHEALKEPIRQAKLAAPSRQPVRRGMRSHPPPPHPTRQLGHKMSNSGAQSNILKQTMKMARERWTKHCSPTPPPPHAISSTPPISPPPHTISFQEMASPKHLMMSSKPGR